MAEAELNQSVDAIRGKVGRLVFRKTWGKQTVFPLPDYSDREGPASFIAQQKHLSEAGLYWRMAKADPVVLAAYTLRAKELRKPTFSLVYRDFYRPPVVQRIDLSAYSGLAGQKIAAVAVDDFEVISVAITVRDAAGTVIESGLAANSAKDTWIYQTAVNVTSAAGLTVEVIAFDRPGNYDRRVELMPRGGT